MSLIFSRMTSNLGIQIRNMPPLQYTTVARLRQTVGSALPPTLTPMTIWKSCQNRNRKLLDCFSYPNGMTECQVTVSCIQYTIEWKVTVNKKVLSRDTEEDVALTRSAYWPMTLKGKLEKLLEGKTLRNGRVKSDDTSIVVSVNDRSQRDLMKRFDHLDIDWAAVEKQLLRWGEMFCRGKKLRLSIFFKYVADGRLSKTTSGRVEKRGRSSVTKRMLTERDAQLDGCRRKHVWARIDLAECLQPDA